MKPLKEHILIKNPTHLILQRIAKIYEYKGKEPYYEKQFPKRLEKLFDRSLEDSVYYFHRSHQQKISKKQVKKILQGKAFPSTPFEQEMLGYYDVLCKIHKDYKKLSLSSALLLKFFKELYQYTPSQSKGYKQKNNSVSIYYQKKQWVLLKGVAAASTPKAMDKLNKELIQLKKEGEIEPILLIATYIFDFFVIHPFFDGNGRLCRLLIMLLLYQFGFHICRYVSLEKIIEKHYDEYYVSLYHCTRNKEDLIPWWEFMTKVLLESYEELEKELKVKSAN